MKNIVFKSALFLSSLVVSHVSVANGIGIFGLHNPTSPEQHQVVLKQIKHNEQMRDCNLLRHGKTNGAQGNLNVAENNHYFMLECPTTILSLAGISKTLESINKNTRNLMLLEGNFSDINREGLSQDSSKRAYILKISHFNNKQPAQRTRELAAFKKEAYALDNHYYREAFINVQHAYGVKRPDELAIIYYDTQESGDKFRQNNPKFIEKIGQFNMKHLTEFTYVFASANN